MGKPLESGLLEPQTIITWVLLKQNKTKTKTKAELVKTGNAVQTEGLLTILYKSSGM